MTNTRTITLEIPADLRLGQAIIGALARSGDIDWVVNDDGKLVYSVAGQDLFYITDKQLQDKITEFEKWQRPQQVSPRSNKLKSSLGNQT